VFELKGGNLTGKLFLKVFSLQEAFKNCYIWSYCDFMSIHAKFIKWP
jgi:hypothetical protein